MTTAAAGADTNRFDIQFLRGVAVLAVVLFHAFGDVFARGYLGVDIFFVISGYLITGLVLKGLQSGTFSFRVFYLRRAKRLLPAAYSTFLATTLLGYLLLTSGQWSLYLRQLGGALTFSANIVLWLQTDYFAPAAEAQPLLHIWSLSLEEQFYFAMPCLLWLLPGRLRPGLIAAGFILSLALCLWLEGRPFAFFMLPTRAWELLAGSACAWLALRGFRLPAARLLQRVSLLVAILVCIVGLDPVHPRGDALLVVAATALMILGGDGWLPKNAPTRAVATIGDWSYSLYLVHWPLFSFAFIAYSGEPPLAVAIALAILSLILGWAQFRWVETPFRRSWPVASRRAWVSLAAMTTALVLAAAPAAALRAGEDPEAEPVLGLARECRQQGALWQDLPACRTSAAPAIAVWGDSNAMQIIPAFEQLPMIQLTKSACTPVLDVAHVADDRPVDEAAACISFNRSAFARIANDPRIRTVVLASNFFPIFVDSGQRLLSDGRISAWRPQARRYLLATVGRLRARGKDVILLAPVPRAGFDPAACAARAAQGVLVAGRSGCDFTTGELTPAYGDVRDRLAALAREAGVDAVFPEAALCSGGRCRTSIGGAPLYRDQGHLTRRGAIYVARRLGLIERVGAAASRQAPPVASPARVR